MKFYQSYCLGGRQYSNTINQNVYEKKNPRTNKIVKIVKGSCSICGRNKSQIFTENMTRGESFVKNAKCAHGHRSAMSNSACCDLNINCTVLKLHDMCHNSKCNCQKQITFTPKQYMLESGSKKRKLQKTFRGTQTAWNKFLKPAINTTALFLGKAVSKSGGKNFSLTNMHGHGLRLKVM